MYVGTVLSLEGIHGDVFVCGSLPRDAVSQQNGRSRSGDGRRAPYPSIPSPAVYSSESDGTGLLLTYIDGRVLVVSPYHALL